MRLTRRIALERCREMWAELAETGSSSKLATDSYQKYKRTCFACEYDQGSAYHDNPKTKDEDCPARCVLTNIWPGGCTSPKSPYGKWLDARIPRTRKKYAQQIVDGCDTALVALPKRKKRKVVKK